MEGAVPSLTVLGALYVLTNYASWWKINTQEYGLDWTTRHEGMVLEGYASAVLPNVKKIGIQDVYRPFESFVQTFVPVFTAPTFKSLHQKITPREMDTMPDYPPLCTQTKSGPIRARAAQMMEELKHFKILSSKN